MSSNTVSPLRRAWYRWKTLKLPWRKRFLVGLDLKGNTFWEFRDTFNSHKHRMRRIVQYPPSVHYSEISISPQWHQWLRHTRRDPPSIVEQSQDLRRQQNLKLLAAEADARWASKPSFLDTPGRMRGQPVPETEVKDPGGYAMPTELEEKRGVQTAVGGALHDKAEGNEGQAPHLQIPDGIRHRLNQRLGTVNDEGSNHMRNKEDPHKKPRL